MYILLMNLLNSQAIIDNGDFSDFFVKNGLMASMASVSVGLVSGEFIKSFVSDIVFPTIVFLLGITNIKMLQIPLTTNTKFNFIKFFQSLVSLIIVILTTYYFIRYISRIIIQNQKDENEQKEQ
jgi:large-conductance mechanosensitive channel